MGGNNEIFRLYPSLLNTIYIRAKHTKANVNVNNTIK